MFVDFALKCPGASLRDASHPKRLFYYSLLLSQSFITLYYSLLLLISFSTSLKSRYQLLF
jgi:hypothetical protein